jgi:hypothetical protein
MKTTILKTSFTIGIALILATSVFGRDWKLAADIPFAFNINDQTMASGSYTVEIRGEVLVIRSSEGQKLIMTLSNAAITPSGLNNGRLVFNRYGDQYFLSEVNWAQGPSRQLMKSKLEIQTAKQFGNPRRLDVATK